MIELEVFVHSHFETGEAIEVDVFSAKGHIDLIWLFHIFDKDHIHHNELAKEIHKVINCTEEAIWIKCEPDNDGIPEEWWIDIKDLKENKEE